MKRTKFKKKKSISVAARKQKGRLLQQWAAKQISDVTGLPCGKDSDIESRPMAQSGTDVRLSETARKIFPFSVECKRQENWSVQSWIRQAQSNQLANTDWLLVARSSHMEPIVVIDAKRFFEILRNVKENERRQLRPAIQSLLKTDNTE